MGIGSQLGTSSLGLFSLGSIGSSNSSSNTTPPPASRTFTVEQCSDGAAAIITPSELLDWLLEWDGVLDENEKILTSAWTTTGDLDIEFYPDYIIRAKTGTVIWLTGGTIANSYILTNTITTSNGRIFQASFRCYVNQYNNIVGAN